MARKSAFPSIEDMDPQSAAALAKVGTEALQSGLVHPKEAAKTAKGFGFDLGMGPDTSRPDDDMWNRWVKTPEGQTQTAEMGGRSPASDAAPAPEEVEDTLLPGYKPRKKTDEKLANTSMTTTENKNTVTENTPKTMDEETLQRRINALSMMPAIQESERANRELERSLPMAIGRADEHPWIKGILSGVDAMTGSQFAPNYTPGMSAKDRNLALLKYQDEIAKRKAATAQEYLKGVSAMKEGYVTAGSSDIQRQLDELKKTQGQSTDTANPMDRMERQIDARAYERLLQNVKNDKDLRDTLNKIRGTTNGFNLVDKLDVTTPNQFNEAQVILRSISQGLGGAGTRSGVEERASTYVKSMEKNLESLVDQYGANGLASVPPNDAQLVHFKQALGQVRGYLHDEFDKRLRDAAGGRQDLLRRNPQYADDLGQLLEDMRSQTTTPANMTKKAQVKKAVTPPAGGQTKVVGGKTYQRVSGGWQEVL